MARVGLPGSSGIQAGLAGEGEHRRQRSQAQGARGPSLRGAVGGKRPNAEEAEGRGRNPGAGPEPRQEAVTSARTSCPCFQAVLRSHFPRESLNRGSGKGHAGGYLPDPRTLSNLWDRDQKTKEMTTFSPDV